MLISIYYISIHQDRMLIKTDISIFHANVIIQQSKWFKIIMQIKICTYYEQISNQIYYLMEYLTKDTLDKKIFSGHCLDITIQNYSDMFKLNSYQLTDCQIICLMTF